LEDFGRYTLAGLVASGLYVVLTPVFNAIYPRMSALVASGEMDKLIDLYRSGTRLLLAVLFPMAIAVAVFSEDLLFLWTGNPGLAQSVAPVVSLFLIGTALNGVMHFPYALQLAYGMTRLPLMINGILIIVLIPATVFLALQYGVVGGASSWALLNGLYLFIGTWLTHRFLLKGIGLKWLFRDVALPLGISLLIVGLGGEVVRASNYPHYSKFLFGGGLAILASGIIILSSPRFMLMMRNNIFRNI
jgi:O-antigen/teichoic acid export membrane protein